MNLKRKLLFRVIGMLFVLCGCFSYISKENQIVCAATDSNYVVSGEFEYKILKEGLCLIKYDGEKSEVSIPKTVKGKTVLKIGPDAFKNNKKVKIVNIPNTVQEIEDGGAFENCSNLKEVNIATDSKMNYLGEWTFYKCKNLETINLPHTITKLTLSCFEDCISLKELKLHEGIEYIEQNALSDTNIEELVLPSTCVCFYPINYMPSLKKIEAEKGNPIYISHQGVLYEKWNVSHPGFLIAKQRGECVLIYYPSEKTVSNYQLPEFATGVYSHSFVKQKYLKTLYIGKCKDYSEELGRIRCNIVPDSSNEYHQLVDGMILSKDGKTLQQIPSTLKGCVVVPAGVKTIATYAAERTNMTKLILPESVETISGGSFWYSYKLKEVDMPENLTFLGDSVFQGCTALESIRIPCGIEEIYYNTFQDCPLKSIVLPNSIKRLEWQAFSNCTEIKEVFYCGTEKEWKDVLIEPRNMYIEEAEKHFGCVTQINKASLSKEGKCVIKCEECEKIASTEVICTPKTIKLSTTKYIYNGKVKQPSVTVKDTQGNTLKKGTDYTVTYASGRKSIGRYAVTIKFKGNYSGEKQLYFYVLPSKTSKITPTSTRTEIKASWKNVTGATGYKVELLSSKGKVLQTKYIEKLNHTFKSLSKATTYKIKVTAYKTINDKKYYSTKSTTIVTSTTTATTTLKATAGSKKATLSWKKVACTGYEITYDTNSKFSSPDDKVLVTKSSTVKKTISKLTKGKTYYFKIRSYKTVAGVKVYGSYSKVVKVKIK